jgi:hypothetical protein
LTGPTREYLRVTRPRDVIELPITDELDVTGWDLFKALTLFRKNNAPLLEWLHSPIVYQERGAPAPLWDARRNILTSAET